MNLAPDPIDSGSPVLGIGKGAAPENGIPWIRASSREWRSLTVQGRPFALLELMLRGALGSYCAFMRSVEDESVRRSGRLPDGTPWLTPLLLPVCKRLALSLGRGDLLAIRDIEGVMLAALRVDEIWNCANRGASDYPDDMWFLAGPVIGIQQPASYSFRSHRQRVSDLRLELSGAGFSHVIAFLAVRPIHRSTFDALIRTAKQTGSRVLIIGAVSLDLDARHVHSTVRCWLHAVEQSSGLMQLSLWPIPAPLTVEGLFLAALVARNSGCESLLTENCPEPMCDKLTLSAGLLVKNLPHKVQGGKIFDPHTEIETCLREERPVPESVTFPAVARELSFLHRTPAAEGVTVFFTGLSGSGKSTIANALQEALLGRSNRPVTLLDGDVVRQYLSSELGFSREHRELNVTRIGFVAMEIAKHGGIAICAPIAPYEELRTRVRNMIQPYGIFVLVYVSTPLEVCEQRDRKGLYARARHGLIQNFTGISDAYEVPVDADVVIDTSSSSPSEAVDLIVSWLVARGCLPDASRKSEGDHLPAERTRAAAAAVSLT